MATKKLICIIAIYFSYSLQAQIKLIGTIKDKLTNEVLPGVILYFPDLRSR